MPGRSDLCSPPHTHPPPRNGLPRANSSLPSGLTPSRPLPPPPPPLSPGLAVPGAPSRGDQRETRRKGGDKGAGSQGSSQIRLSRLQARSSPSRVWPGELELSFSAVPCPSPRITTSPAPPTQRRSRRRARPLHVPADPPPTAPHPLGTGSTPGLPTEGGARDRVASAPCRFSGDQEAAPMQTPAGPGRPLQMSQGGAASRAPPSARPPRRRR